MVSYVVWSGSVRATKTKKPTDNLRRPGGTAPPSRSAAAAAAALQRAAAVAVAVAERCRRRRVAGLHLSGGPERAEIGESPTA